MSYSRYYRPALKNSVDVQLQTAFSDGNWPTVIRLADKRARTQNDAYFQAVKVCAESQLDGPAEKYAAAVAVDALVRQGPTPKDVEALELYEWACRDIQPPTKYPEGLGILRLRWVKANPRSPACISCLQSCLQHWDLVNAQQIAAVLDKSSNARDRRYMYWSIALTYLLSISPQCPDGKQKLYGMLALKQLERAAEKAERDGEASGISSQSSDRDMQSEEEINLFYKVLATHGSRDDIKKKLHSPHLGALKQFDQGRKHLFLEALATFEGWGDWDSVYGLCRHALTRNDEYGSPSLVASDWRVWQAFIAATSRRPNAEAAFIDAQDVLERFVSVKSTVAKMYVKNMGLALLDTAFSIPPTLLPAGQGQGKPGPRIAHIHLFIEQHVDKPALFDDIKAYVEDLTYVEGEQLIGALLPELIEKEPDIPRRISLVLLGYKLRCLLATSPRSLARSCPELENGYQPSLKCKRCASAVKTICAACLQSIIRDVGKTYREFSADATLPECLRRLDRDPRVELSLIASMCLIQLAASSPPSSMRLAKARLDGCRLLQAIVVLDSQLHKTPDDIPLRFLLVQFYLLLGCASIAYQLWLPLDVKRTIQDGLSPHFFDRLSSISPGLFQGGKSLMEPLRSYYSGPLQNPAPVKVWDAFLAGCYSSIVDMAEYKSRLSRSCTRVMALVEERRAARAFGGRIDELDDMALLSEVTDETQFVNATDHGPFPSLESSHACPVAELLRIGPGLSNVRSHLSLLAERYIELVTVKPSKDYRPSKANEAAAGDQAFVVESLNKLCASFTGFLQLEETPSQLTAAEEAYYNVLSLLSAALTTSLSTRRADPISPVFSTVISSLKLTIAGLRASFLATPPGPLEHAAVLYSMMDQHTMSTLRDAALAVKHGAAYALGVNEREAARDRSGKSNLQKDVLAEMRGLEALGTKTLAEVKDHVRSLKEQLNEPGWLDRVGEWAFGDDGEGGDDDVAKALFEMVDGRPVVEDWAGRVLDSWREGIKGWGMVRME